MNFLFNQVELKRSCQGLEKELELERRKLRELQDTARERDKDYQKLKARIYSVEGR